jgi:hypothetical protein
LHGANFESKEVIMGGTDSTISKTKRGLLLTAGLSIFVALTSCSNALIYSEGTNVSIASIKVNDNVGEPLSLVTGLDRTVAVISPPAKSNQESVNMLSGFKLDQHDEKTSALAAAETAGLPDEANFGIDTLEIRSEFASGSAAVIMAESNSGAAASILNVAYSSNPARALDVKKQFLAQKVQRSTDTDALRQTAVDMGITDLFDPKGEIKLWIDRTNDPVELDRYERIITARLGAS